MCSTASEYYVTEAKSADDFYPLNFGDAVQPWVKSTGRPVQAAGCFLRGRESWLLWTGCDIWRQFNYYYFLLLFSLQLDSGRTMFQKVYGSKSKWNCKARGTEIEDVKKKPAALYLKQIKYDPLAAQDSSGSFFSAASFALSFLHRMALLWCWQHWAGSPHRPADGDK